MGGRDGLAARGLAVGLRRSGAAREGWPDLHQGRNPADLYPSGILDRRSWAILRPVTYPKCLLMPASGL